ncbi:serine hydrolase [bacterium]|nr:serine hydrolase [bacterium]
MRNKIHTLSTVTTLFLLFISVSCGFSHEKNKKVDRLFEEWDKTNSPGCALAVIHHGKIIYKQGYGMANLELDVPITPHSLFYIGSCSKQFVAMCIALLENRGKLTLDDPIQKYIPEIPEYNHRITIHHLIHHTSGLRDYLSLLNIAGIPFGYYHEADVLDLCSRQKELNFTPGEKYMYSNSGYFLLSMIIERVSGQSLREFARKNIFDPLGMNHSHFHDDYTRIIENRASGYFPAGKGKYKNFISKFDCVGSGGLFTTVEDLFLWDQNFYHHQVGGKEVMDLMHTRGTLNNGEKLDYAFGLKIGQYKGLKTVSHGGALGGYRSAMVRFPENEFSVICLSNLSTFNPSKLSYEVADIYLNSQFEEEKPQKPQPRQEKTEFIQVSTEKLKSWAGSYIHPETHTIRKVHLEKGNLMMEAFGKKYPLKAVSEKEFRVFEAPIKMTVEFEKRGKKTPSLLHITREDQTPQTYQSFQPPQLTETQLHEYTGNYFSEELRVYFQIALKEGKLHFVHRNASHGFLHPISQDSFKIKRIWIHFNRSPKQKVTGFTLDTNRVKHLRFIKTESKIMEPPL